MLDQDLQGTTVRLRQIEADSIFNRHFSILPSLQSLCRDVVLVNLITNNTKEKEVRTLVDRLGVNMTHRSRDILLQR